MDKQLAFKIMDGNASMAKDISDIKEEFTNAQRNSEK
jgi:hypothetical protein